MLSGSQSQLHTKSVLKIKDENTKRGTQVDGVKLEGEATYSGSLHKVKVGTSPELFRLVMLLEFKVLSNLALESGGFRL